MLVAKLGANSAEIVFGLLLGVLGGAFGIGAGIQSVNGFHQRQRFLAIGRFAFRNVGVGMHAGHGGAQAGRSPCDCSLGVSFISRSARLALESSDFLSFLTHLMGLSEWGVCEVGFAASDAPAPAGPCAAACRAPTVRKADKPNARIETLRRFPFMLTSSSNF